MIMVGSAYRWDRCPGGIASHDQHLAVADGRIDQDLQGRAVPARDGAWPGSGLPDQGWEPVVTRPDPAGPQQPDNDISPMHLDN
jgi:hypothetical protein